MPEFSLNQITLVPTLAQLFFSKNDPEDPRLGELFKPHLLKDENISSDQVFLWGYPDDEGIKLNGGRPGAAEAPRFIRQFLYKMTPSNKSKPLHFDLGDLTLHLDLPERHAQAQSIMTFLQMKKARTLTFGGGHDYGYSDTSGFVKAALKNNPGEKPVVINFDAHLDVRPTDQGFNSGTPFFRLLNEFGNQIEFAEVGLQPQCNSIFHREWAQKKGATLFDLKDLHSGQIQNLFQHAFFKKIKKTTPVFISFDIDCLTSSEAAGCSQSWATGLTTQECLRFLNTLYTMADVRGLGIYEVSPPLDQDFKTSKTAALIAYHFLFPDQS